MTIQPAGKPRSILLEQLPADVMARLSPDLQQVDLAAGKVLCKAGVVPSQVYFPCSGLVSMRYLTSNGDAGEIASVGNEGVIGATLLFGSVPNAIRAVVQTPGTAVALKTDAGLREFARNGIFQAVVLRYTTWLLAQVTQAAICNRHHSIEQQLSRWLLAGFDRLGEDQVQVTHEALANLLGVRREGITEAAGRLQDAGGIRCGRGSIRLVDRRELEQRACECYLSLKRAYARLAGPGLAAAGATAS
jgi:CRP-like cAMP-binding protein